MPKKNVILVTDGDPIAQSAVEKATANIGGRCISASGGNPTKLKGAEIIAMIKSAPREPVVVMVDDKGDSGRGRGEKAMEAILEDDGINVLGVLAVSSDGRGCNGAEVTCSIDRDGLVVESGVDKEGNPTGTKEICGDTLGVLRDRAGMIIVGIGDIGKMDLRDEFLKGSPITTRALKEVMARSGFS